MTVMTESAPDGSAAIENGGELFAGCDLDYGLSFRTEIETGFSLVLISVEEVTAFEWKAEMLGVIVLLGIVR